MKFGKEFRIHLDDTLPDWRDKFLCYKPLKKLLKNIPLQNHDAPLNSGAGAGAGAVENVDVEVCFVRILEDQLEKFNDFYVDKEEEFVIRLQVVPSFSFLYSLFLSFSVCNSPTSLDVYDVKLRMN